MSDLKIENLQQFFKNVGLDDSDFEKLSKEDIEDFTPFVEKAKHGIKEHLMADSDFLDSISKPYKDAPIGKEKQLKKEARKFFNLQLSEDELTKTSLSEILKRGTEHISKSGSEETERLKTSYTELLEENERLKNEDIPTKLAEKDNYWKEKIAEKDIKEELQSMVAMETQVPKENISVYSTTFQGYLSQLGYKIAIDNRRTLSLKDSEGLPAKNSEGGILKLKDALKDFATKMQMNIKPITNNNQPLATNSTNNRTRELLRTMGAGFIQ